MKVEKKFNELRRKTLRQRKVELNGIELKKMEEAMAS